MTINERLYKLCRKKAAAVTVDTISIGLGYTAVQTSDGGLGTPDTFKAHLADWTDVLILTSTSLLNDRADAILAQLGPGARTVVLGPSTPMIAAAFEGLPVHMLAGAVPVNAAEIFKGVRFGMGTPVLLRSCRKKYLTLP